MALISTINHFFYLQAPTLALKTAISIVFLSCTSFFTKIKNQNMLATKIWTLDEFILRVDISSTCMLLDIDTEGKKPTLIIVSPAAFAQGKLHTSNVWTHTTLPNMLLDMKHEALASM